MADRYITPPVGSVVLLYNGTSPTKAGYGGTWKRLHLIFVNKKSGRALDVAQGGTANGTNVDIYDKNLTYAQSWWIESVEADTTKAAGALDAWMRTA